MKKYLGNYLGIVVSPASDDPENRNRVQIWIPHITNTLYDNWNENPADRNYFNNTYGTGLATVNQLQRLRQVLPWAECASPTFGGGTPFIENTASGRTSIDPYNVFNKSKSNSELLTGEEPQDDLAGDLSIPTPDNPAPEDDVPSSGDDLPSVEPDLPDISEGGKSINTQQQETSLPLETAEGEDYFPSTAQRSDPSSNVEGQTPTTLPKSVPTIIPQSVARKQRQIAERALAGVGRSCSIDDVRSGNLCLRGVTGIAYAQTGSEEFLKPTGTSAFNIRTGSTNASYFQDTGLYDATVNLPSNYKPQYGDVVLGNRHVVIFQGYDENKNEIWWSDFRDKSPAAYGWNSNNSKLIRLNPEGQKLAADVADKNFNLPVNFDDTAIAEVNDQLIEVDDWGGANMASAVDGGHDGTATGSFSSPDIGAKVWVFFHGGDIQKPVYFAQAIDPASYGQAQQGIFFDNEQLNIA
jgi:hypothetical protein